MRPASGRRSPSRQPRSVVLPAPLGPMMPNASPGRTASDTESSARPRPPPYVLLRPSISIPLSGPPRTDPGRGVASSDEAAPRGERLVHDQRVDRGVRDGDRLLALRLEAHGLAPELAAHAVVA